MAAYGEVFSLPRTSVSGEKKHRILPGCREITEPLRLYHPICYLQAYNFPWVSHIYSQSMEPVSSDSRLSVRNQLEQYGSNCATQPLFLGTLLAIYRDNRYVNFSLFGVPCYGIFHMCIIAIYAMCHRIKMPSTTPSVVEDLLTAPAIYSGP